MKALLSALLITAAVTPALAHVHKPGETPEAARVVEFYKTWLRPQGVFSVQHRQNACCWSEGTNQDCFPVLAFRRDEKGVLEITLDTSESDSEEAHKNFDGKWYKLNTKVEENIQIDPRESPDHRAHACVAPAAEMVVCFVPGWGT